MYSAYFYMCVYMHSVYLIMAFGGIKYFRFKVRVLFIPSH